MWNVLQETGSFCTDHHISFKETDGCRCRGIAKSFEPGKKYSEREINICIADYNDDFCTIRCDMISEGILEREGATYWLK